MDEKTTEITAETDAFSNRIVDGGGTGFDIEKHLAENETESVENEGIAGDEGSGGQMAGVEMPTTRRKRGRPRKYKVDGERLASARDNHPSSHSPESSKRRGGRPRGSGRLQLLAASGGVAMDTAGGIFTPHIVNVGTGENIVNRILSFSQRGPRAICILCATGAVSNVTMHHPDSKPGANLRYEGFFEILTLCGSYVDEMIGSRRKRGKLSVSLATPEGRVFGGTVASSLIAATPVQLIVASFKQNVSNAIRKWHKAALKEPADTGEASEAPSTPHQTEQ